MDITTAKDIAAMAAPLTTLLVNTFLKPKLETVSSGAGNKMKEIEYALLDKFSAYLDRSYNNHSFIRTVVFQNNKRLLNDLYIPLTLTNTSDAKSIKVDCYPEYLLPAFEKVLLVDTAGMGKSTLSRYLLLQAIDSNRGIPLFIELRQLKQGVTILDLIHNDINSIDEIFDKNVLLKLIKRGDFIFFFDGFDEISPKERVFATQHLQDFISKASGNKFLLTSRQDPALAAFADFQQFIIQPLKQNEAYALLKKYDTTGTTADSLIEKLKKETSRARLSSFLTNPLLVSLLFKAYDFKPTLPLRADVFYRQVYEALFENHDLSKGGYYVHPKLCELNIDDFARVLRVLGMRTVSLGSVQYTFDELAAHVREARERCVGLAFSESDFIKDLTRTVPLFVQEGNDYRWSHKSFQEYFAALFISTDAKGDAEQILQRFVESREQYRFSNVLELYYDIDQGTFRRALTKNLIEQFLLYLKKSYSNFEVDGVSEKAIQLRKLSCFSRKYVLFPQGLVQEMDRHEKIPRAESKMHITSLKLIKEHCTSEKLVAAGERIVGSTHFPGEGAMVIIGKPYYIVLEVLNRKKDPLILNLTKIDNGQKRTHSSDSIRTPGDIIKGKTALAVTDDVSSPLNQASKFYKVNQLLVRNSWGRFGLNEEACKQALVDIGKLISRDNVKDFLTGI